MCAIIFRRKNIVRTVKNRDALKATINTGVCLLTCFCSSSNNSCFETEL